MFTINSEHNFNPNPSSSGHKSAKKQHVAEDDDYELNDDEKYMMNKNLASVISLTQNRRLRTSFTSKQIDLLESVFVQTHYPDANYREEISQSTGLNDSKIQIWFSNRRAKWRKNSAPETMATTASNTASSAPTQQATIKPDPCAPTFNPSSSSSGAQMGNYNGISNLVFQTR